MSLLMRETTRKPAVRPIWRELTIAVPSYSRPRELEALIESALELVELPGELLICEDNSPQGEEIRKLATKWGPAFSSLGSKLTYRENETNLGYDGNVREALKHAAGPWVMLIGNDDHLLPQGVVAARERVAKDPELDFFSSAYLKFKGTGENTVGMARIAKDDPTFTRENSDSGVIVRAAGFVGGLIIRRTFATGASTAQFDGTLYYQVYLAALAFSDSGIGYISTPTVASRVGNPPLFGAAVSERQAHKPGVYGAAARVAMWEGILDIGATVQRMRGVPMVKGLRRELAGKQAFHVFEIVAPQGRGALVCMVKEFIKLRLFNSPIAWALTVIGLMLGGQSRVFFLYVRRLQAGVFRLNKTHEWKVRGAQ